jgi:hypothetical protein
VSEELFVAGKKLRVGDVIIRRDGSAGAVLMQSHGDNQYGEPMFWTDTKVIASYRKNQVYRVVRGTAEEMEEACNG